MSSEKDNREGTKIKDSIKELVITRIDAQVPSNLRLSIGMSATGLTKEQMIEHVQRGDSIGKRIIEAHLRFIKAQVSGQLTSALVSAEE